MQRVIRDTDAYSSVHGADLPGRLQQAIAGRHCVG